MSSLNMKNKLHKWILGCVGKHSLQYLLIETDHYDQRCNAQFSSIFVLHSATPYFSYHAIKHKYGQVVNVSVWLRTGLKDLVAS
jgi:hypothetical protein